MKLNKFLARCEVAARRKCDEIIKNGEVTVDGEVITNPLHNIDETKNIVKYNNKILKLTDSKQKLYVLFYKPRQCITAVSDDKERITVIDYLKKIRGWKTLYPVGRLDYDTEGLLILTNDGDYAQKIMHPSNEIIKCYLAKVEGAVNDKDLKKLERGFKIDGKFVKCKSVRIIKSLPVNTWIEIKIITGENRVIRKMCDYIHHSVIRLIRTAIGGFTLDDAKLKTGEYIILNNIQKDLVFYKPKFSKHYKKNSDKK